MCVFCEIIKGNIPSRKVYEDDKYIAILDIAQTTIGHTLVIPKKHYNDYREMTADEFADFMKTVHKVADKVMKGTKAPGNHLLINTDAVSGQTVEHVHCHIIPRYSKDDTIKVEFSENKVDLDEVLNKINA